MKRVNTVRIKVCQQQDVVKHTETFTKVIRSVFSVIVPEWKPSLDSKQGFKLIFLLVFATASFLIIIIVNRFNWGN